MGNIIHANNQQAYNDNEEEIVKVIRVTDGEAFHYLERVFVEDLMFGFPGYGVFTNTSILSRGAQLNFNRVYYLIPLVQCCSHTSYKLP